MDWPRHRVVAQCIHAVLGKRLAARVLFTAREIKVLVLALTALLFVGETIGRGLEAVVFEPHIRRAHHLPVVELAHIRSLFQRTVAETEEELGAGGQGGRVIGKHNAMFALLELVEVEHPLFGSEPVYEIEVSFPILNAIFPLGMLVLRAKGRCFPNQCGLNETN